MNPLAQLSSQGRSGPIDPWNHLDPSVIRIDAGRTIVITDEMRAADAAQQAEREAKVGSAWSIRSEISVANLRVSKPKPRVVRVTAMPRVLSSKPKAPVRFCKTCPMAREPKPTSAVAWRQCEDCGATLHPNVTACPACKPEEPEATAAAEPRFCSKGCGRRLRRGNQSGLCFEHHGNNKKHQEYLANRKACAKGCGRFIRRGKRQRTDGLCSKCGSNADRAAKGGAYAKRVKKLGMTCSDCSTPIGPSSASGKCPLHARKSHRITLITSSADEHELNQLWAGFTLADKWAVLESVMGGGGYP